MKKINKNIKRRIFGVTSLALTPIAIASLCLGMDYNKKVDTVRKVEVGVYTSLISNEILEKRDNRTTRCFEEEDLEVTQKLLDSVSTCRVYDKGQIKYYLEACKNLKEITIIHADSLTDADIEMINNSSIEKVILVFNEDDIVTASKKFDLSKLKKINEVFFERNLNHGIKNKYEESYDEILKVRTMSYLYNSDPSSTNSYTNRRDTDAIILNDRIDKLYGYIGITDDMSDEMKTARICAYIIALYQYDESISYKPEDLLYTVLQNNVVKLYNEKPISMTIGSTTDYYNGSQIDAICINYAALFDILAFKAGLNSRLIIGRGKESAHAWNAIEINGEYRYVDTTFMDNDDNLITLFNYINADNKELSDEIRNIVFTKLDYSEYFDTITGFEEVFDAGNNNSDYYSSPSYINEHLDGEKVLTEPLDVDKACNAVTMTATAELIGLGLYSGFKKKKTLKSMNL